MKKKAVYRVERSFCEKLVALLNRGTSPVMDIFHADKETKRRIVIDYDPQKDKVEVNYFEEEVDEEKIAWLNSIGAKEFPEPIKYVYTFPEYCGVFNLSEEYVRDTPLEELKAQYKRNENHVMEVVKAKRLQKKKIKNWISVNLPENCPNVCISFKREIAEIQIKKFGAKPLYGFDSKKEDWLPVEIFITYEGTLAPEQRRPEV